MRHTATSPASSHGLAGLLKLLGSVTAVQLLGFILLPWLGRLYTQDDYGLLGTIMAAVGITTLVANGRYDQAAFVAPSGNRQTLLRALAILINLSLTTVLVVLCLLAPRWLEGTSYERLSPYLMIIPLTTLGSGLVSILSAGANVRGEYARLGVAGLAQGYLNNGLKVLGGYLSMGVWGFAMAFNSGLAVSSLILGLGVGRSRHPWLRGVTPYRLRVVAGHYVSFPKYTIVQALVSMLISSVLQLTLPAYYLTAQIGLLTMLYMITRRPVQVYGDATSRVYARRMVEARASGATFAPDMRRLSLRILGVGVLVMLVAPWIATPLVELVIGEQWSLLGGIIVCMIPFLVVEGYSMIFDFVPDVVRRQSHYLGLQTVRLVSEIGFILVLAPRLEFGVFIRLYFGFAAVAYLLMYLWFYHQVRRYDAETLAKVEAEGLAHP